VFNIHFIYVHIVCLKNTHAYFVVLLQDDIMSRCVCRHSLGGSSVTMYMHSTVTVRYCEMAGP